MVYHSLEYNYIYTIRHIEYIGRCEVNCSNLHVTRSNEHVWYVLLNYILASSHLYILMFLSLSLYSYILMLLYLGSRVLCAYWYPCIFTSSYPLVHILWVLVNTSHPYILSFMYSGFLLVFLHTHILMSLGSCTLGAC